MTDAERDLLAVVAQLLLGRGPEEAVLREALDNFELERWAEAVQRADRSQEMRKWTC